MSAEDQTGKYEETPPADIPRPFEGALPPSITTYHSFDSAQLTIKAGARVRAENEQLRVIEADGKQTF